MKPRLLIVSPHFPPVNAPDLQRVRMSLPAFVDAGWEVTVLTVDDPTPTAPLDPELATTVPASVRIERAHCWSRRWTRWLGVGNVAWRALPFLFWRGLRLLRGRRFDVVYFSTTMFIVLPFGRIWRALTGVPYVVDLQDPWVTDFYERPDAPPAPGGWKYRVARRLALVLEGWSLRQASHIIAVSPEYPEALRRRYDELPADRFSVIPFGAPDSDLAQVSARRDTRPPLLPAGRLRLAFAGAIGPGMMEPARALLLALRELRAAGVPASAHFFGTSYAPADIGRPVVLPVAQQLGVAEAVTEVPGRLPYLDALQVTLEADLNLVLGSRDPGFVPSKLLAVLAARRPLLAIVYANTALAGRLAALGVPAVLLSGEADPVAVDAIVRQWRDLAAHPVPPPPPPMAETATALAGRQLEILARAARASA